MLYREHLAMNDIRILSSNVKIIFIYRMIDLETSIAFTLICL
jgi:predicted transcriptional regulator